MSSGGVDQFVVDGWYCTNPFAARRENALALVWDGGIVPRWYCTRWYGSADMLGHVGARSGWRMARLRTVPVVVWMIAVVAALAGPNRILVADFADAHGAAFGIVLADVAILFFVGV